MGHPEYLFGICDIGIVYAYSIFVDGWIHDCTGRTGRFGRSAGEKTRLFGKSDYKILHYT